MRTKWLLGLAGVVVIGTLAASARGQHPRDPRAAIFIRRGCNDCHAIAALQVRAAHDVAPDLTYAYGDVLIRYGVDLETFLAQPSGVMRLMLGSHIHLSTVDRDSIVQTLRALHVQRTALRR